MILGQMEKRTAYKYVAKYIVACSFKSMGLQRLESPFAMFLLQCRKCAVRSLEKVRWTTTTKHLPTYCYHAAYEFWLFLKGLSLGLKANYTS